MGSSPKPDIMDASDYGKKKKKRWKKVKRKKKKRIKFENIVSKRDIVQVRT